MYRGGLKCMVKCTKGQEPWNPYWHCGIRTGSILGWVVVHCFLAEFVRLVRINVAIFVVTFVRGGRSVGTSQCCTVVSCTFQSMLPRFHSLASALHSSRCDSIVDLGIGSSISRIRLLHMRRHRYGFGTES